MPQDVDVDDVDAKSAKRVRPMCLVGRTYQVETPLGTTYVTVNEYGDGMGDPFELFVRTSKGGSETAAVAEALGRLCSYILRMSSDVSPLLRLEEVRCQLVGIGGGRSIGLGPQRVRSLADGIARALGMYLSDAGLSIRPDEGRGEVCPTCGDVLRPDSIGDLSCSSCGYSRVVEDVPDQVDAPAVNA